MKQTERPVVVTTKYRGVFFGYAENTSNGTIHLKRARMCVYWDSRLHGVLGLASDGPCASCRISRAVTEIDLRGITSVIEVTPEAVEKWEAEPWK